MRSVLRATALACFLGVAGAPSAAWADGEFLRITPSTIQAGFQVEIEANCGDAVNPATVSSDAFGVVTITPQRDPRTNQVLDRGQATIPPGTKAGSYKVLLKCPSQQTATTTLHVVNTNPIRSLGPHTGGGYLAHNDNSGLMIGAGSAAVAAGALLFVLSRRRRA